MDTQKLYLPQAINTFLKWKSRSIKSAQTTYRTRLLKFQQYVGASTLLSKLTELHIMNYHSDMERSGYSDATIAFSTRIIRSFINFWFDRKGTQIIPGEIKVPKFLTPEQPVVELEDFELMSDLLDESYTDELQRKLAIHLLWDTGMRVSEMTGLKLGNLRQTKEGIRTARIKTKKTDRYNVVMWSKETEELLTKYLGWRVAQNHPTDFLFIRVGRKSSKGLTTKTVERWVKKLSEEALLDKTVTPHSFRHGKAHYILNNGGTAIDVQTVLRHKNLNSSLNYMRLNETQYIKRAGQFFNQTKQLLGGLTKTTISNELAYNTDIIYTS